MSKLEELIKEYCPDGVEYKKLEDIIISLTIGVNPRKFFNLNPKDGDCFYVTVRELNGLSGVKQYGNTNKINKEAVSLINTRANIQKGDILFSNTGTVGKMALVLDTPTNWAVNEGIYVIKPKQEIILPKFLYYWLSSSYSYKQYSEKFTGSTLKHVTQKALLSIQIPLPPLPVQREIVRILDNFSQLTAELNKQLTAELAARKKQYSFYRDQLLTFAADPAKGNDAHMSRIDKMVREFCPDGVEYKALSESVKIMRGRRVVRRQLLDEGAYPVFQNSLTPLGYYDECNCKADTAYIIVAGAAGEIGYSYVDFWAADDCFYFDGGSDVQNRYLYHVLMQKQSILQSKVRKASIPRLSRMAIENLTIPVPPLPVQREIVSILDRFDALCNDLSSGLPAEIEARKKQYEYYGDKLLTFKPLS